MVRVDQTEFGKIIAERSIAGNALRLSQLSRGLKMKSAEELKKVEKSISKSNAPSKTKPVTEPLFRNTGVKAYVDRGRLPQSKLSKVGCEEDDSPEVRIVPT